MMIARDEAGRPLVNTPEEALKQLAADYDVHRIVAALSFTVRKKRAALQGLEHTLSECKRAVAGNRAGGNEDFATQWRQVEEFVQALHDEMRMALFIREQKFHAAWSALISAQGSAHWAARWLPDFEPAQDLEQHLSAVERVAFPKQRFFSPSMVIDEADVECNICHVRGGECDHIAGDIYAGEVAHRVIHSIKGVREVSMVDNPANKQARAMSYDGMDLLTGETTNKPPSDGPPPPRRKKRRPR
jgi:hypothetical protein